MPTYSYIVLGSFTFLGIGLILTIIFAPQRNKGIGLMGQPTIEPFLFYTGKFSLFFSWGFFLVKAIFPGIKTIFSGLILSWAGATLVVLAAIVMLFAFVNLGASLRVGLPAEETSLKTKGIYRLSRNPIYLGVFMINIGSILFFPNYFNLLFSLYGMVVHHRIIKGEEKFLAGRFGKEWEDYTKRVRRYL